MTVTAGSLRNRLLCALAPEEQDVLLPHLDRIEPQQRDILFTAGTEIEAVHFPEGGFISVVALSSDGRAAEVGLVGREGMVGLPLLLAANRSSYETVVQAPAPLLRMPAAPFREAVEQNPTFRTLLLRYALAFQEQIAMTALCNGHHTLEERLARWLLTARDRQESDELPLTQEFLALMLCVRRPGVTIAARTFQQAGLIRYGQGRIRVTDRPGLEAAACDCYRSGRQQFSALMD